MNDLRFACRQGLKNPGFTAVAVLTLALGIGACVSIFSVANAMFLRDRPYHEPGRLVWVWQRSLGKPGSWLPASAPNFADWQREAGAFAGLAAFEQRAPDLEPRGSDGAATERIGAGVVTVNLFEILGVRPLLGRTFQPDDAKNPVVVMSYDLWQGRFKADPDVLDQTVRLNGKDFTVIGVMPPRFHFPPEPHPDVLWIPLSLEGEQLAESERGHRHCYVLGRLRPGASLQSAQAELDTIMQRLAEGHPAANRDQGAVLHRLNDFWHHPFERIIDVLLGAVGLLVLMACFNVANLLLARAVARQQEIALRTALGARRLQIVRQLLVESLLLSLLGGAAGLALAFWGTELLAATIPPHNYRVGEIQIDAPVLAFAVTLSLVTGLVFGLVPALVTARVDLSAALKEGARLGESRRPQRWRDGLVVAQIALAVVLLSGALITVRSFFEMRRADWGFQPERLLTARLPLPEFRYTNSARLLSFDHALRANLRALPGVEAVATSTDLPMAGEGTLGRVFQIEGRSGAPPSGQGPVAWLEWVSPRYFQTLGQPLLEGRDFNELDFVSGANVAIISRQLARQHFAGVSPVGQRLRILPPEFGSEDHGKAYVLEIVGVAGDARRGPGRDPLRWIYIPYAQNPSWNLTLAVRTAQDPSALAPAMRKVVAALDPQLPVLSIKSMPQRIREETSDDRVQVVLWALFASVALGLAAVGIYGMLCFSVTRRTRDIAVRMALGASRQSVLRQVMARGLRLTLGGLLLGLVLSWAGWRVVSNRLYVGTPLEPPVMAGVILLLASVAAIACWLPARRATRIDPMEALRYE